MFLTTTLNEIDIKKPGTLNGFNALVNYLGVGDGREWLSNKEPGMPFNDKPINILTILDVDLELCLRVIGAKASKKAKMLIIADMKESIIDYYAENGIENSLDDAKNCIAALREYAIGILGDALMKEAWKTNYPNAPYGLLQSDDVVRQVGGSCAAAAARLAAGPEWEAAESEEKSKAAGAKGEAAWKAEEEKQTEIVRKYFEY